MASDVFFNSVPDPHDCFTDPDQDPAGFYLFPTLVIKSSHKGK
jgi:hypothetical protein